MFEENRTLFKIILNIAHKRENAISEEAAEGLHDFSSDKLDVYFENKKKCVKSSIYSEILNDIFFDLDLENIKDIIAIMYLGEDEDYNDEHTPEEIFESQRTYFDEKEWDTKKAVIRKIMGKTSIGTYLENGFKILNIKL